MNSLVSKHLHSPLFAEALVFITPPSVILEGRTPSPTVSSARCSYLCIGSGKSLLDQPAKETQSAQTILGAKPDDQDRLPFGVFDGSLARQKMMSTEDQTFNIFTKPLSPLKNEFNSPKSIRKREEKLSNKCNQIKKKATKQVGLNSDLLVDLKDAPGLEQSKLGQKDYELELSIQRADEQVPSACDMQNYEEKKEDLSKKRTVVRSSMRHVDDLTCSICMDYIINCKIAVCGHSFCDHCISEWLIRKKICPVCRKDIRKHKLQSSSMLDSIVSMILESKKANGEIEEYKRYIERVNTCQESIKRKTLLNVEAGDKVDVRDTEYIWCVGTVELKITTIHRAPLLYVHYEGWNRKYDEYLYMNSKRVAPLGSYSKRTDIPRYYMCPHSNMMYGHIMENAQSQEARNQQENHQDYDQGEEQQAREYEEALNSDANDDQDEEEGQIDAADQLNGGNAPESHQEAHAGEVNESRQHQELLEPDSEQEEAVAPDNENNEDLQQQSILQQLNYRLQQDRQNPVITFAHLINDPDQTSSALNQAPAQDQLLSQQASNRVANSRLRSSLGQYQLRRNIRTTRREMQQLQERINQIQRALQHQQQSFENQPDNAELQSASQPSQPSVQRQSSRLVLLPSSAQRSVEESEQRTNQERESMRAADLDINNGGTGGGEASRPQ